LAVTGFSL